ncbi:reticulon-1 isoform X2 [Pararge aegeria]|uniref:reticulon-1 isoform X2 n=1 Tax=Pararge aegeria TaxID=116150 RepID=UPI0019D01078|nr:reticulon-1 isoform X2 [Pararge aegeria]
MDSADKLIAGLASGDGAAPAGLKREQDSTDDFEHLDGRRDEPERGARHSAQSFLDAEREEFVDSPRAPSADKADHLADKFTDSESDADTAGESPLHRPEPPRAPAPDPTPALAPTLAPAPEPQPSAEPAKPTEPKPEPAPQPKPEPVQPKPEPVQLKPEPTQSKPDPVPQKPEPPSWQPPVEPAAEPLRAPVAHVIEAEVIFCQMGLVESLIYWRSAARSGAALGAGLALLVALACCSVVSVLAYSSLLALSAAVAFRVYKNVLQAVQKTNEGHPFKWLLEKDVSVSAERAQSLAAAATAHLNAALTELRRLFLVEDLVDSLKFGALLWCLTYVGACFNGITLIILAWIALFSLPKAYEMNKAQVDANLELARSKINEISAKVRAAVPLGRKAEDKDK